MSENENGNKKNTFQVVMFGIGILIAIIAFFIQSTLGQINEDLEGHNQRIFDLEKAQVEVGKIQVSLEGISGQLLHIQGQLDNYEKYLMEKSGN